MPPGRKKAAGDGQRDVSDWQRGEPDEDAIRRRAHELSQVHDLGTDVENWLRAEREFAVAHDYDTVDRDLERLGLTISRLPSEAGVVWRLSLPRGERLEEWEPGTGGLVLPAQIARLVGGVVAGKPLVPGPPLSGDPGARRLREMIEEERRSLLAHDPGTRLGEDPENLHQHRVAGRRTRAFVRATAPFLDLDWQRSVAGPLGELGEATGPVRDLDVLLEHVNEELRRLPDADHAGGRSLVVRLERDRCETRARLLSALESDGYRVLLARLRFPPRLAPGVEKIDLDRIARKEFRRLAKAVRRLGKEPKDEALHELRIKLKRARYAAELAAPAGKAGKRFVSAAKTMQTLLGEHQDAVVAEERLRAATVVDGETAAAFAAGRLAERQVARRRSVTEKFPAAWRQLRRSGARLD